MPPTSLNCTKEGCDWTTPVNCPDWEKMIKLLELHTMAEHGGNGQNQNTGTGSGAPWLEKLPRPSFTLDMSQNEWAFKQSQWEAYISQTPVAESVKV